MVYKSLVRICFWILAILIILLIYFCAYEVDIPAVDIEKEIVITPEKYSDQNL